MNQEAGIVKYQSNQMTISDLRSLAADFAKSNYFQDAREMAQAVVKIQAGIELGFGPVYSMTKIYIVKGKVMVSAEALGAMVKRSGRYDYTVKSLTDTECILEFTDNGRPVYSSKFTMEDAKRAELVKADSGWAKWPRAMLMSKSLSQGARIVCPHVISGVYTPEDFGIDSDEQGNIIEGEAVLSPPPIAMITEAQRKKIFATAKEKGLGENAVSEHIQKVYSKYHLADLTKDEAKEVIEAISNDLPEPIPEPTSEEPITSELEPDDVEQPKGFIDESWVEESLNTLKTKKPETWNDRNILSFIKASYKVEADNPLEAVKKLKKGEATHFTKKIEDALKSIQQ